MLEPKLPKFLVMVFYDSIIQTWCLFLLINLKHVFHNSIKLNIPVTTCFMWRERNVLKQNHFFWNTSFHPTGFLYLFLEIKTTLALSVCPKIH